MMNRDRARALIVIALAAGGLLFAGCKGSEGTFGFKTPFDDQYRKPGGTPEFGANQEVMWVCVLSGITKRSQIGTVYQKKEVVWVEVKSESNTVDRQNLIIYGTIANFKPGEYRIIITDVKNDNRIIARKGFRIYSDDSDDDFL